MFCIVVRNNNNTQESLPEVGRLFFLKNSLALLACKRMKPSNKVHMLILITLAFLVLRSNAACSTVDVVFKNIIINNLLSSIIVFFIFRAPV
jgi:hypothetical protein